MLDELAVLLGQIVKILDPHYLDRDRASERLRDLDDVLDAFGVGCTLVDDDFAGQAVHLHRAGEELDRRGLVAALREHEVQRLPELVHGAVKIDPMAFHLDVDLVRALASACGSLVPARIFRDLTRVPLRPMVECGMVNHDTPLDHDLLEDAVRHPVAQVEEDRVQDHVLGKVGAFE